MSAKPKRAKASKKKQHEEQELWIAPRYNLKGPAGERAWENRVGGVPNSSRFLELADVALGLKKPTLPKKPSSERHDIVKTEPYSS